MRRLGYRWAVAAGLCSSVASCDPATLNQPTTTIRLTIVARPVDSDTIQARATQAIVAELRDESNQPLSGAVVRFTPLVAADQFNPTMLVGSLDSPNYFWFVADSTDARGRVAAIVQFGPVAGPGQIEVAVPEFGLADTVTFTIRPGAPVAVNITPRDTAFYPGVVVQLRGAAVDRFGNKRTDPVSYSVTSTPTGIATVSASGQLAATGPGRIVIKAVAGAARDSANASAVPRGTLAAVPYFSQDGHSIVIFDLDGSNRRSLGTGGGDIYQTEPEWAPSGTEIAFTQTATGTPRIGFVSLDNMISDLFIDPPPELGGYAYWPSYSRDGQYLYFSGGAPSIWRAKRDGTGLESLTAGLTQGSDYRPSASPDGRFVAFYSVGPQGVVVRILEIATKTLTPVVVQGRFPAWSPLGDQIGFVDNDALGIKVMNVDGTGVRFVSVPGRRYGDSQISWSPDGLWIAAKSETIDLIQVATRLTLPIGGTTDLVHPTWKPTFP